MRNQLPLVTRALGESWRGLIAWAVGVVAVLVLYLPLYPSIGGSRELQGILDSLPPELIAALGYDQISTGAGYTQSTFFGLVGFVVLVVAATAWGSSLIAGDWESGRLELDLAHGVGRVRVVLEAALTVLVKLVLLLAITVAVILVLDEPFELEIETGNLLAAAVGTTGLAYLSAAVALLVGAVTGRRSLAATGGALIAAIGYVMQALAKQSADLEWLGAWSPYLWVNDPVPLIDGWNSIGFAKVWGLGLLFVAGAALVLRRRDIT
ncbi:ABC transporter permease subunit [Salinibacterium sp. ZJ77]|uniref:ABC transporter permease subunit n=1 Tax=Salinibacterium sp. ZJ77 TaxID=2708337 RepID=UPI00141E838B|nr:ABC transporter permease subunit [Salinibacterium sp. ZJ77]